MGYSVREERLRATVWLKWNGSSLSANWSHHVLDHAELYDHTGDEGQDFDRFPLQHRNMVRDSDKADDVRRLVGVLQHHFDRDHSENAAQHVGMWSATRVMIDTFETCSF